MSLVTYVDLLVIGGGPAGLSSATTFSRLKRTCLLYDSELYRNQGVKYAHLISGFEHSNPYEFKLKMKEDLLKFYNDTFEFRSGKIINLRKLDFNKGFEALDDQNRLINAKKVILATGLKDKLPNIQGVKEQWGKKLIHCIFCHGTETANAPFAFLLTRENASMNPKLVESMLKLWRSLNHTEKYILTHGMDVETEQGRKDAGLEDRYDLLKRLGYKIISTPIMSITETSDGKLMDIKFEDNKHLEVPAMLLFPEGFSANEHATPLLTEDFLEDKLAMFGTIAPPSKEMSITGLPPRMGDDPRTNVKGLFWAGNSGSAFANITISLAQGQNAAVMAGDQIGEEEMNVL